MKDKLYIGLLAGLTAPFIIVALIYLLRFNYLSVTAFIEQAFVLKVHLKIVAIGVFFANLGLFYLFLRFNKNNASKGVILSVFLYFFIMLFASL
ncbi:MULTISPECIES: hypothetical protein [Culturomica]|jgi:hypothetical protein|uniref:hypothetical protein n=1 Tax=Culturomica TaxID=1926651 RepID=UPI00033F9BC0|nr:MULTISPECIES: hypothetical protein [Odoribacteraceae]RHV94049.1 hypothetical protein DXA95_09475 [Odoribacter sp. OF09-27XD]CCZ06075.1 putative uncharacterized protein [Odoribacter sp. CAG:788]HBO26085.1 hypothetical protein [Culturomica sp.]